MDNINCPSTPRNHFGEKTTKIALIVIICFGAVVGLACFGFVGYMVFMDVAGIGTKPIHRAAERGALLEVQRLIEGGASIDLPTADGRTPLSIALYKNKKQMAFYLIEKGANVKGLINSAIWMGDINLVKAIVDRGERIRSDSLLYSVSHNDLGRYPEFLDYLLNNGADIDARESHGETDPGFTALHIAAKQRDLKLVAYLVNKGADINVRANDGRTPLEWAEMGYRQWSNTRPINYYTDVPPSAEIAEFLRSKGAR
ncbi:MAG: ankyrin repeat domain-containing protein [Candidatus Roizmanbacteria bacterium]|nr:ankyrin repeat domain-containing protein [Candidatus Roizmanbacteria bacterium]